MPNYSNLLVVAGSLCMIVALVQCEIPEVRIMSPGR